MDGDQGYSGLITKNPSHDSWESHWVTDHLYELKELQEHLDAAGFMPPAAWTRTRRKAPVGLSRNCDAAGFDARQTWLNDATKSATRRDSVATNTRQPLENTGHDNATAVATERDSVATEVAELRVMLEAARQEIKAKDLSLSI